MQNLMLLDISNIAHVAAHTVPHKEHESGMPVNAIHGVINKVRDLRTQYTDYKIVGLLDGHAKFRHDMWPHYKSERKNNKKVFKTKSAVAKQLPFICKCLQSLGITTVKNPQCEADDLAAFFTMFGDADHTILVSNDKDWQQLIRHNVSVMNGNGVLNLNGFKESTGLNRPIDIIEIKALAGDSSDSIAGVGGIGEKGAKDLIERYGTIDNMLYKFSHMDSSEIPFSLPKNYAGLINNEDREDRFSVEMGMLDRFRLNCCLIDLSHSICEQLFDLELNESTVGEFDKDRFTALAETLDFHSACRDIDKFTKPFERDIL